MALYKIHFTQSAFETLPSLHPEVKKFIKEALKDLKKNPFLGKQLKRELAGYYTYRFKRYRIISTIDDLNKSLTVHYVGHRRDVYVLFANLIRKLV